MVNTKMNIINTTLKDIVQYNLTRFNIKVAVVTSYGNPNNKDNTVDNLNDFFNKKNSEINNQTSLTNEIKNNNYVFKLFKYASQHDNDLFLHFLQDNINRPIDHKNKHFGFSSFEEFKGFKKSVLQSFVKTNPTTDEFNNAFHSFFKDYSIKEIFQILYVNLNPNIKKHDLTNIPYIDYLLQQDFNHKQFTHSDFTSSLEFNYPINENNYPQFKESLFVFVNKHFNKITLKINTLDFKTFQENLFKNIHKFIKTDDLYQFDKFWPELAIKKTQDKSTNSYTSNQKDILDNFISLVHNSFVIDVQYSYLNLINPEIANKNIAKSTLDYIVNIIQSEFNDQLELHVVKNYDEYSRLNIVFKNNKLTLDVIPPFLEQIVQLQKNTHVLKNNCLTSNNVSTHLYEVEKLKKFLLYQSIEKQLPIKKTTSFLKI